MLVFLIGGAEHTNASNRLRYTSPSLPYRKPVQYHNLIVLYVTTISKLVIVVFLKTTINVRLGQCNRNCCFQKNNNYDFDIVVAYSTIRLWYYIGLWYGRLGEVGLRYLQFNVSVVPHDVLKQNIWVQFSGLHGFARKLAFFDMIIPKNL